MSGATPADDVGADSRGHPLAKTGRWFSPLQALPTPAIFAAAAALALLVIWRRGGLDEVADPVANAHPLAVIAVLGIYAASIMVLAARWHTLVGMADGTPAWTASAEVFLTSVVVNYAAPIGLAVPTRAALTVRDLRLSPAQSGTVVAWELGLDVGALVLVSGAWLILDGWAMRDAFFPDGRALAIGAGVFVAVILAMVRVLRRETVRDRVLLFARRMIANPAQRPGHALLAIALTVAFWIMQMGVMAILLSIFGIAPGIALVLGLMGLPVLIGMLSPIPGGAGVREALMTAVGRMDGAPAAPVLLAAVTYRLALFAVTPVVWGLVRLARKRLQVG